MARRFANSEAALCKGMIDGSFEICTRLSNTFNQVQELCVSPEPAIVSTWIAVILRSSLGRPRGASGAFRLLRFNLHGGGTGMEAKRKNHSLVGCAKPKLASQKARLWRGSTKVAFVGAIAMGA